MKCNAFVHPDGRVNLAIESDGKRCDAQTFDVAFAAPSADSMYIGPVCGNHFAVLKEGEYKGITWAKHNRWCDCGVCAFCNGQEDAMGNKRGKR